MAKKTVSKIVKTISREKSFNVANMYNDTTNGLYSRKKAFQVKSHHIGFDSDNNYNGNLEKLAEIVSLNEFVEEYKHDYGEFINTNLLKIYLQKYSKSNGEKEKNEDGEEYDSEQDYIKDWFEKWIEDPSGANDICDAMINPFYNYLPWNIWYERDDDF